MRSWGTREDASHGGPPPRCRRARRRFRPGARCRARSRARPPLAPPSLAFVLLVLLLALPALLPRSSQLARGPDPAPAAALAGVVVVIDPGHGGRDPGAIVGGVLEKDIVLEVGLVLGRLLEQAGAAVVFTRQTDIDFSQDLPGRRKRTDLQARLELVAMVSPQAVLSIHANVGGSPRWRGGQVFYHRRLEANALLAHAIQQELNLVYGQRRQALPDTRQYLLSQLQVPAVCVEIGFMTNPEDLRLMRDPDGQRRIAWAIAMGLAAYLRETLEVPARTR